MDKIRDSAPEIQQRISGYRWRVEECHRRIKQDYALESIWLRKYKALKNMIVPVVMAAAFVMRLPENLALKQAAVARLLPHNRLRDLSNYPFFMFSAAVAWVLTACRKLPPKALHLRKRDFSSYLSLSRPFKKRGMVRTLNILDIPPHFPYFTILLQYVQFFNR